MTFEHRGSAKGFVKVLVQLEREAWHGSATETLWAERLDQRRFRLRNVPFYAFGMSAEDVVFARETDGLLAFEGVSIYAGHSTYRIIAQALIRPEQFKEKWDDLEQLGCTYEQRPGRLMAVDVPPKADIHRVYAVLEEGEHEGIWDFEEGHCGHSVG